MLPVCDSRPLFLYLIIGVTLEFFNEDDDIKSL